MKTYLFVGGESDGERVPLKRLPKTIKKPYMSKNDAGLEIYELMEIHGQNTRGDVKIYTLYKHESIDQITVMRKLLEDYNPKEE